jgi:hypothetical protein
MRELINQSLDGSRLKRKPEKRAGTAGKLAIVIADRIPDVLVSTIQAQGTGDG